VSNEIDPDMYDDIQQSFKYANGQVVRLVTPGLKQYQITIHPLVASENLSITIKDPFDSSVYIMEIPEGSINSNTVTLSVGSTSLDNDIEQYNNAELSRSFFGINMFYQNYSDLGNGGPIQYPLPF